MATPRNRSRNQPLVTPTNVETLVANTKAALAQRNFQVVENNLLRMHKWGRKASAGRVMMEKGVGDLVIEVLDQEPSNPRLAACCCQVVRYLQGNLFRFFSLGGGVAILKSMQTHRADKNVQAGGCYAIRALAKSKANAISLVGNTYNVDRILKQAMVTHIVHSEVQKAACSAVWCLCASEETKQILWRVGIVEHVLESMRQHANYPKVQEYGAEVLRSFDTTYSIVRLGGAEVIINALTNHMRSPFVVNVCLRTLRSFSQLPSNCEVLLRLRAAAIVVRILSLHEGNLTIQSSGLGSIYGMAQYEPLKSALQVARVGRIFVNVLGYINEEDETVLSYCLLCIAVFSNVEENVRNFIALNMITRLVTLGSIMLRREKLDVVLKIVEVFIAFCGSLPEASQTISDDARNFLRDIETVYPYERISRKVAELRLQF